VHAHLRAADHQGVGHVVAPVADKCQAQPFQAAELLLHGEQVGEDLGRVPLVGETVPHRHPGVGGQDLHGAMGKSTELNPVEHAPEHPCRVGNRLLLAELDVALAEVLGMRTLVDARHGEGASGPRRRLLEYQGDALALQRTATDPGTLVALQRRRQLEQVTDLCRAVVEQLEEVSSFEVAGHLHLPSSALLATGPDRPGLLGAHGNSRATVCQGRFLIYLGRDMRRSRRTVLHLSCQRGWRGGERQVSLLTRGLAREGLDQCIAAPTGSPLALRTAAEGIDQLPLHHRRALHPRNLLRVVRWLRRNPGAIVHAHTSPTLSLTAVARRLAQTTGVVHTRRVAFPVRRSSKYRTAADIYVAISRAVGNGLLGAGLDPDRLWIIPSAVDLGPLDIATPTSELPALAGPVVGCVAAMTAEKGLGTLLEAWFAVKEALPEARLVLVGDGPDRSALDMSSRELPPGSIVFAGQRDDVPAWLKSFDVYVQPSLAEGLGTSVLDAMACHLPVVASRAGGLPEAVADGETGILVAVGDAVALTDAILGLLADRRRAEAMGKAGRARVERHFTVEAMVEGYLEVYRRQHQLPSHHCRGLHRTCPIPMAAASPWATVPP